MIGSKTCSTCKHTSVKYKCEPCNSCCYLSADHNSNWEPISSCVKLETSDSVNHPKHYTFGKFEVLEVIEDWKLDYHCGNAIKYIARAGRKNPEKEIEDLEKAIFYLSRKIENLMGAKNDSIK